MNMDRVQENLRTKRLGRTIIFSRNIASTNDLAKELASKGAEEGTVILSETQSAGRGRFGRAWISPRGGLWFSVVFKPRKLKPAEAGRLAFVAGLAVADTLHALYRLPVETKWPNDVLVKGRKICGIIIETNTTGSVVNYVIVGVGINANLDVKKQLPRELRAHATSLKENLQREVEMEELFASLLEKLASLYDLFLRKRFEQILDRWKEYAAFLGKDVEVKNQNETLHGIAYDVDPNGALVLLKNGEMKRIFNGDVSLRTG
jgi:BirA family biotin operon repressor/biotin-[acetyl-CoA-carboxylase] ligase